MPEGLDSAEIDAFVTAAMRAGEDLYHLDEGALSGLDADLVVTQDLCAVCAVDVSVVDDALAHLGCTAEVLTIDPHTLDGGAGVDPAPSGRRPGATPRRKELVRVAAGPARPGRDGGRGRAGAGPAGAAAGVDRPAVRARPLGPRDDHAAGGVPTIGDGRREVGPGDLGAGPRRRARPGGVRAVRLRPGGVRGARPRAARRRRCCPRTSRSGRWTPTRRSRARARAWSTGSRTSPASSPGEEPDRGAARRLR